MWLLQERISLENPVMKTLGIKTLCKNVGTPGVLILLVKHDLWKQKLMVEMNRHHFL